jgi:hypothetical protein
MSEPKRMAEEAERMGREYQEQAKNLGQQYQKAAQNGFEAASRSLTEANKGFQAIAAEMTDYSKKSFDDVMQAWEQLASAKSFGEMVQIQARYAQRAYDSYSSAMSKVGSLYLGLARDASKPMEQAARRVS